MRARSATAASVDLGAVGRLGDPACFACRTIPGIDAEGSMVLRDAAGSEVVDVRAAGLTGVIFRAGQAGQEARALLGDLSSP